MIYIWDNGQDWSEHEIVFVDDEGHSHEVVEAVLTTRVWGQRDRARILGTAEMIEWREAASCPLRELLVLNWAAPPRWPPGVPRNLVEPHVRKFLAAVRERAAIIRRKK